MTKIDAETLKCRTCRWPGTLNADGECGVCAAVKIDCDGPLSNDAARARIFVALGILAAICLAIAMWTR